MKRYVIIFLSIVALWGATRFIGTSSAPVRVTVPEGTSVKETAALLRRAGVIRFSWLFVQAANVTGGARQMKAGTYEFTSRDTVFKLLRKLRRGETCAIRVTIPEGFTAVQIANRLAAKGIVDREKFLAAVAAGKCEGYLFPATYAWRTGMSEAQVIREFNAAFDRYVTGDVKRQIEKNGATLRETVILASIIEKEAKAPEERAHIAGVFYNRLKKHWKLESCATVIYALGNGKRTLTPADLRTDSPYNTYLYYGLPEGPICNPGLESIKAAVFPAPTADLFFRTSDGRTHRFSRYYEEHRQERIKHE